MPGPKSDKPWADAVRRAVNRYYDDKKKVKYLDVLADNLVQRYALQDGNSWAFKEIGERLDGRPPQAVPDAGQEEAVQSLKIDVNVSEPVGNVRVTRGEPREQPASDAERPAKDIPDGS